MQAFRLAPFVAAAIVFGIACGTANLVGAGGDCFVVTDCEPGLACVPQKDGRHICSTDLTNIVFVPDAAEAAPPAEAGPDAPVSDGPKPDASMNPDTSMVPDTSMPDTSMAPDTSMPPDASAG